MLNTATLHILRTDKCRSSDRIRLQLRKRNQRGGDGYPTNTQGRFELEPDLLVIREVNCWYQNTAYLPTLKPNEGSLLLQIPLNLDGACFGAIGTKRVVYVGGLALWL